MLKTVAYDEYSPGSFASRCSTTKARIWGHGLNPHPKGKIAIPISAIGALATVAVAAHG